MKKKILSIVLIFACLFTLFPLEIGRVQANSSSIDQKRADIKERDKEIQQLEKKKSLAQRDQKDLLAYLNETKSKLQAYDQKVYDLQQKVIAGENQLEQIEKQLNQRREILNDRLKTIYLQGDTFYLETLISSNSFGDFLQRLHDIQAINRADQRVLDSYEQETKRLQSAQMDHQKDLDELKQQKEKAQGLYVELTKKHQQHQEQIQSITENLEELEEENEKARQEVTALIAKAAKQAAERERERELLGERTPTYTGGKFYWPVDGGTLTSSFGTRYHPIKKVYKNHAGIDIAAPMGRPIKAAAPGEVIEARPSNGYGYIIVIYHGDGLSTLYAHMYAQTVKVKKGDTIQRGQVIAEVGSNGWSTGPHLHFEVHTGGSPVDPMSYFR
ncbi:murein hydrolase activator EnvC family protein [Hazenella coriacea]|uniref:Septal ring factor EnvC (AmiA/AmiB activator) n=1 Tax=Hazenella coriacea TaxID=1179467 RepID=A0A4R3L7R7_9BACL|nr:peptidoglycan DD-metalloendopeptidase family protein [Hazenella coriacea]TCS95669.1 septal ring factor EnvC (AmiA/AmiB activator) [Hazenella coriacea]